MICSALVWLKNGPTKNQQELNYENEFIPIYLYAMGSAIKLRSSAEIIEIVTRIAGLKMRERACTNWVQAGISGFKYL